MVAEFYGNQKSKRGHEWVLLLFVKNGDELKNVFRACHVEKDVLQNTCQFSG